MCLIANLTCDLLVYRVKSQPTESHEPGQEELFKTRQLEIENSVWDGDLADDCRVVDLRSGENTVKNSRAIVWGNTDYC